MVGVFHQNLRQLRKNKRVSQRIVAGEMHISQALLSHYENGIREPGLDFVNRACAYYGVSADFLLGRTEADVTEPLEGSDDAELDADALVSLLQTAHTLDRETLYPSALRCFGAVAYRLLRHVAAADLNRAADAFAVPGNRVAALSELELRLGEVQFLDALERLTAKRASDEANALLPEQMEALLLSLGKQISNHIVD